MNYSALTVMALLGWCGTLVAAPVFNVELRADAREVDVIYKGRRLLVYQFGSQPFKPYVRELCSLEGINVLQDAPADHLHHHGLMYAVVVNGVNYWEETPQSGYQRGGPEIARRVTRGGAVESRAELEQQVYWVPSKEAKDPAAAAVLVETRAVAITVDEASHAVLLDWRSDFAVGPAATRVTLSGAGYHGLGLRLAEPFHKKASRRNGAGLGYTDAATWDVTAAAWDSMTQNVQGRELTVTMYNHPSNAVEPRFFSMLNPFAYVSATQALDKQPLEYTTGQTWRLRYLVTVHSGSVTPEGLARRYAAWSQ